MQQETDVAHGEVHDGGDFFVALAVLKFEADDFLLARRQAVEQGEDVRHGIALAEGSVGREVGTGAVRQHGWLEGLHAHLLAVDLQRPVATNRVQPLRQVPIDLGSIRRAESHEGVLDDILRGLEIAGKAGRIAEQRALMRGEGGADPLLMLWVCAQGADRGFGVREFATLTLYNAPAQGLLEVISSQ